MKGRIASIIGLAALSFLTAPAFAYTGGPIRAEMVRYDLSEQRVYFRLQAYDESSPLPEFYYLDLNGSKPRRPIRAAWLEPTETSYGKRLNSPKLHEQSERWVPLRAVPDFSFCVNVESDSTSVDPDWNVTRLTLSVQIRVGDDVGTLNVEGVCEPWVRVRGLMEIPGRAERVALVSYVGRPYGCEEIDTLVLIPD